ncbi:DUF305 domain-containing protein [Micromonospora sp. CPCC 205561]|uniref:DUF305 domain-containing protein n=1 Tax=Micromonospora sp. CPCC 205561 TaxID=3122407 RepID=UPI002FF05E76
MTNRRARTLAVVTLTLTLLLTAVAVVLSRTGDDPRADRGRPVAAPTPTSEPVGPGRPAVIVPGRPGESAATRPAEELRDAAQARHNAMDVSFVRMMIPHHAQALEMAELAPDRAGAPALRALAERIRAAQGPEIGLMRGWLRERGLPAEAAGHEHAGMRGMQTPEAMRQLAAARGTEFDRLFVRMMTEHHQGAVRMATDLLKVGSDLTLSEFANSVATEQTVEIDRMRELPT